MSRAGGQGTSRRGGFWGEPRGAGGHEPCRSPGRTQTTAGLRGTGVIEEGALWPLHPTGRVAGRCVKRYGLLDRQFFNMPQKSLKICLPFTLQSHF